MNMSAHDAATQLKTATDLDNRLRVFNRAWISYIFIAACGSIMVLGNWISESQNLPIWPWITTSLVWLTMGIVVIFAGNHHASFARRGFSRNWVIAILLFAFTYVITLMFPIWPLPLIGALLFPSYALVGILLEMWKVQSKR